MPSVDFILQHDGAAEPQPKAFNTEATKRKLTEIREKEIQIVSSSSLCAL